MSEIHISVPTSWSQLKEQDAFYLAKILLEEISETELLTRCLCRFSGLHIKKQVAPGIFLFKLKREKHLIDADTFADMLTRLEWIKEEVKLFKNPAKIGRYSGCNYKLNGITLEEYLIADQMYLAYSQTQKDEYLNKLVALCYRKKSDSWNEGVNLKKWTSRFKSTAKYKKHLVYLWFTGLKAYIIETYPYIFQGDGSVSLAPPTPAESVMSILATLSCGDISKYDSIKKTELHEALDMLNRKCKD